MRETPYQKLENASKNVDLPPRSWLASPNTPQLRAEVLPLRAGMYEQPTKFDIDSKLSVLMHESRRVAQEERSKLSSEAMRAGALQSGRFLLVAMEAIDKSRTAAGKPARITTPRRDISAPFAFAVLDGMAAAGFTILAGVI